MNNTEISLEAFIILMSHLIIYCDLVRMTISHKVEMVHRAGSEELGMEKVGDIVSGQREGSWHHHCYEDQDH